MALVTVKIDSDDLLDMFSERLDFWIPQTLNEEEKRLFLKMYESYIDSGVYEEIELDIMQIVDNDVINWCQVYQKDELDTEDWQKLSRLYDEGERDVSCENFEGGRFSFIEAKNDKAVLIRF